jgi:hypothetical protein
MEIVKHERKLKVRQLGDGPACSVCGDNTYVLAKSRGDGSWAWCPRVTCGSPTTVGRFEDLDAAYRRTEEALGLSLGYGISYSDEGDEREGDDSEKRTENRCS